MKKNLLPLLIMLLCLTSAFAQQQANFDKIVLEQAHRMGNYFLAKDYDSFAKFNHPVTIKLLGGMEKAVPAIKTGVEEVEAQGIKFISIKFVNPGTVVQYEDELQCTLTQLMKLKVEGGIMETTSTMIAMSKDNGKNWLFIDTTGNDIRKLGMHIPLSPDLVIPEPTEPSFVPDAETKP